MIVASIDIGSNSVRLLIADVVNKKINNIIFEKKYTTRLAENIDKTQKLSNEAIDRTIKALKDFNSNILKYNVKKIKAVATSAVREAENSDDFIKKTKDFCFDIEVIDGDEESLLTFEGVISGIDIKEKSFLLLDIGGGSTEFVFYNSKEVIFNQSIKLGVVKLADMFDFKNKISKSYFNLVQKYLEREFAEILNVNIDLEYLVATAGTPTTLAAIKQSMKIYEPEKINGFLMNKNEIQDIFEQLCALDINQRLEIDGLEKGREDLIIPGIFILLFIMNKFKIEKMIVSDNGLREGVAIAAATL